MQPKYASARRVAFERGRTGALTLFVQHGGTIMVAKISRSARGRVVALTFATACLFGMAAPGSCQELDAMTVLIDSLAPEQIVDNEAVEKAFTSASRTKSAKTLA